MANFENGLRSVVAKLSDQNYAQSLAFYRFWFDIGRGYLQIPSDRIFDVIWENKVTGLLGSIVPAQGKLIHPTAHLILRFAGDLESDHVLAPYAYGLRDRLCTKSLQRFFDGNMGAAVNLESNPSRSAGSDFYAEANLVAHSANLGYLEEVAIRNHILQALISYPKLYDHQADALVILFKLAGATFEAYAAPSVVDRCFDLLKSHKYYNPYDSGHNTTHIDRYVQVRRKILQVCDPPCEKRRSG